MNTPAVANIFGILGAVCWSVQLIPQIIINWRRHNATGLQPTMMMFWAWAGVPLGIYNIFSAYNIALQIQPQILAVLSLLTWIQCHYYEKGWSLTRSLAVVVPIACVMAAMEVALVFSLRVGTRRGVDWPVTLMAILASLFLALGVLRHYWDIFVHRTVRGISFIFVSIDALGDLTSIISVIFQPKLDILGLVIYGVELTLWVGIFACGGYYNLVPLIKKQLEKRTLPTAVARDAVAVHDLPSSTSVFRTPSSDMELRSRGRADESPPTSSPNRGGIHRRQDVL